MLTKERILNAKFTPVSRGAYSAEEVDAFLKTAAEAYEESLNANEELIRKMSVLADKIESYRNDEEAIKLSLLDARRTAESVRKEAEEKARAATDDAESRAKIIIDGANRQSSREIERAGDKAKEIVESAKTAVDSLTEKARIEAENAVASARSKAEDIVSAARAEAEKIIGDSKKSYEFYASEFKNLQSKTAAFKAEIEKACAGQLKLIEALSDEYLKAKLVEPPEISEKETAAETAEKETGKTDGALPETGSKATVESAAAAAPENSKEESEKEIPRDGAGSAGDAAGLSGEPEASEEKGTESDVVYSPREPQEQNDDSDEEDLFALIDDLNFDDLASPETIAADADGFFSPGLSTDDADNSDDDITSLFDSALED